MNSYAAPNRLLPHSASSTSHDDPAYKTALKGASLAFQKTAAKAPPAPPASNRNVDNGALIAATSASRDHSLARPTSRAHISQLSRQTTGNSFQVGNDSYEVEQGVGNQRLGQHGHSTHQGQLMPPAKHTMADPRSPSFIAATLAASRSGSPSPNPTAQVHPYAQLAARRQRKTSIGDSSAASSMTSLDLATDSSSIPSTNALISMFEKRDGDTDPVKRGNAKSSTGGKSPGTKPRLQPSTSARTLSPVAKNDTSPSWLRSSLAWERAATPPTAVQDLAREKPQQLTGTAIESRQRPPIPPRGSKLDNGVSASTPTQESGGKPRATTPPPKPISRADTVILSPQPKRATLSRNILSSQPVEPALTECIGTVNFSTSKRPGGSIKEIIFKFVKRYVCVGFVSTVTAGRLAAPR
ncbi:Uu.00g082360.m01.CDS01 [Anthostomella pinea]|uniref:Uu.00g082360.m01.CDS01 n=1 Tax=Anthostomella pinea TaxID=933095 RepID=A0AAI8YJH8_9PEZI|nr:Uu.00g082360.m01.CDS01 [Anthostomella pinea]